MNELKLYNKHGEVLFSIEPEASSSHDWSLMSENKLSISFELDECVILAPGCFVDFDGIRYYLLDEYKPKMKNSVCWRYDIALLDAASWLGIILAMNTLDGKNAPIFNYTGPAREHAAIIVANLNRRMGTTAWKVGNVIDTPNIAIEYRGKYCSQILQEVVDSQNTEWWVDDMTLNIGRAEFGDPVELGYRNGLLGDIVREQAADQRSFAYLVPVGSTRNIDPTKYGHDRLQLPGGQVFVDMNPEHGVGELIEERAFADIYPRYEGTVQYVRSMPATGNDGREFTIYYFGDMLPFNPNDYEIAGLVKRITFQSGELMGQEFEVNYNAEAQEFEIITQFPDSTTQLPGGLKTPSAGDRYVVWNITMPDEYYTLASREFLQAAERFAETSVQDASVYKGTLDYIDVQARGISVRPGRRVRLLSDEYFPTTGYYESRITRMTRRLWYPDEISIDVSAVRVVGSITRLQTSIQKAETQLAQLSGAQPTFIKSGEQTPASDKSVYTSAKSEEEFFNRRKGGTINAPITTAEVLTILKGVTGGDDSLLYYDSEHHCWVFKGDVIFEDGIATFATPLGFTPSTVMDGVRVDGKTIIKTEDGLLAVVGGGGGLDEETLKKYLDTNEYAQKSDIPTVYEWAQAENKPKYKYSEIEETPSIPTIPESLPNPKSLKWSAGRFENSSSSPYDGSTTKTIKVPTSVEHLDGGTLAGDLTVDGDLLCDHLASLSVSDERLKRNIRPFSALKILSSMGGVFEYEYAPEEVKRDPLLGGTHHGFIFQRVAKSHLPEMCLERKDGFGGLNYLHPDYLALLGGAIIELCQRLEVVERRLK